ncbi:FAD binding domain protein [Rhizodiscina lignyota]|uniref:FAD binding domain protein n=1 Tax=Rhizodiscina lignyota TaxID=1504668 RepID=A0A9P4I176_9PEZI|nr:FAD binding domain protein [Rhizodiscina lignyota]
MAFPNIVASWYTTFSLMLLATATSFSPAATRACSALKHSFPTKTFSPKDDDYTLAYNHSWSKTCVLPPTCVFEPTTAQDVSTALKIVEKFAAHFAVRSGGHMPVPGAASIQDGVLISLSKIDQVDLNPDGTATIGTGLRWFEVYEELSKQGLAVAGGRFGDVGVGGLLLGGGVSHFGPQYGWSANCVTRYEIVLAGGRVLDVTKESSPDLFWALKGGLNNYGIVTRFTLKTFPLTDVYGGAVIYDPSRFDDFVKAVAFYSTPEGGMSDSLSAIEPVMAFVPSSGLIQGGTFLFHQGSDAAPSSLANFTAIPANQSDASVRSYPSFVNDTLTPEFNSYASRQLYFTVSLKACPQSVFLVNNTFAPMAFSSALLKKVSGFTTTINHQPMPLSWIEAAQAAGGDTLDLDPAAGPFIIVGISSFWDNAEDDDAVFSFHKVATKAIVTAAEKEGLNYPFLYVNDADPVQKPFQFYGKGKSLPKMRTIAKKYDPAGVFHTLQHGIWSLF